MIVSPNQLTMLRMALVPFLAVCLVYNKIGIAILVFLVAGITDMLDGLIARHYGQQTTLGVFLDPIADKLLLVTSFTLLSLQSINLTVRIPLWLTISVISRDLLLVLGVLVFNLTIGNKSFPPSLLGKITTVVQLLLIMMVLVSNYMGKAVIFINVVTYAALILTISSGTHYMIQGMRIGSLDDDQ